MPRNMSFMLTTEQVRARTKTVTRRQGWLFLKVGDELNAVKQCQGLKKGEKIERLARIRVVSVRREPVNAITAEDVAAEGFGNLAPVFRQPHMFVEFFCQSHKGCTPTTKITRIEFEYLD